MKVPKPRFSLRTMFVLVTLCGVAVGVLALPTGRALRYVSLIKAGDWEAAERMLPQSFEFQETARQFMQSAQSVQIEPLDLAQLLQGRRKVTIDIYLRVDFSYTSATVDEGMLDQFHSTG